MRRLSILVLAIVTVLAAVVAVPLAQASPADEYSGPYFGEDNFPPGCIRDMSPDNPDNICHHMRTGLNALDSPQVDVAILVPVSPTAERDMRIMRQSVEMWEGGIDYLADEMDLPWLRDGMDFHITVDYVDLEGDGDGGEFTTYPIVDPEIVIIATNPVGGAGIGIDPVPFVFTDEDAVPCHERLQPLRLRVLGRPARLRQPPRGPVRAPTPRTAAAPVATSASRSTARSTRSPRTSTSSTSSTWCPTSSATA